MQKDETEFRNEIAVLSDLLRKQNEIRSVLDTRANIMIGFCSGLILFLVSYRNDSFTGLAYSASLLTLFLSLMSAVLAIKPPHFLRKNGQQESIFYHDYIGSCEFDKYEEKATEILGDKDKIRHSYLLEVYNMTKYSNQPKKFYAHLAIRILMYGVVVMLLIYVLQKLFNF